VTKHSNKDGLILGSWESNADRWTSAVRQNVIPSRQAGTDRAIIDIAKSHEPKRIVDVGCGEGWLVRKLAEKIRCAITGVDGSAKLIGNAQAADKTGNYLALTYQEIERDPGQIGDGFDLAICNFSLLGEKVAPLIYALRSCLVPGGSLLVQTVHPWSADIGEPYVDGWREETFSALAHGEWAPMPWYFRTLSSWIELIGMAGFTLIRCVEPIHPETGGPLSLILSCRAVP